MTTFDPYNIIENLKKDNNCIICHDTITEHNYYPLPECGHIFHTDCIVTWFRSGKHKCPLCNDMGINYEYSQDEYYVDKYSYLKQGKTIMKNYKGNINNLPKDVRRIMISINNYEEKIHELNNILRKRIKLRYMDFEDLKFYGYSSIYELEKDIKKLSDKKYNKQTSVNAKYRELGRAHIYPLIIPKICYMNE